jgi:hypothetical protein
MKGKSCRVLAAILLAMITLFSVGCDFNFTPTDDTKTTHTVSFVSEGKEISKTEVETVERSINRKPPFGQGIVSRVGILISTNSFIMILR